MGSEMCIRDRSTDYLSGHGVSVHGLPVLRRSVRGVSVPVVVVHGLGVLWARDASRFSIYGLSIHGLSVHGLSIYGCSGSRSLAIFHVGALHPRIIGLRIPRDFPCRGSAPTDYRFTDSPCRGSPSTSYLRALHPRTIGPWRLPVGCRSPWLCGHCSQVGAPGISTVLWDFWARGLWRDVSLSRGTSQPKTLEPYSP